MEVVPLPFEPAAAPRRPRLWAVAGGKGGVGKSVVAANLGVALASHGLRVTLVDLDLGGANLHTMLGVVDPGRGVSGLVAGRARSLAELAVPTPVRGLELVGGAHPLPDLANPKHAHKEKILRHLALLEADHVVVDLGAGASSTVLDFFLPADVALVVVAPEAIAVENAHAFLRAAFFRLARRAAAGERARLLVEQAVREGGDRSPRELLAAVDRLDWELGLALRQRVEGFRPAILVNRLERPEQGRLSEDIAAACRAVFGCGFACAGALPLDPAVPRSVEMRRPVLDAFPDSPFAVALGDLARRLLAGAGEGGRP